MEDNTRHVIVEMLGVVTEIDKLAEVISKEFFDEVMERIKHRSVSNEKYEKEKSLRRLPTPNGDNPDTIQIPIPVITQEKIPATEILIKYYFDETLDMNSPTGSFKPFDTSKTEDDNGKFTASFKITIPYEYNQLIFKKLSSIFSHEIHHFYDYAKRLRKASNTNSFNLFRHMFVGIERELFSNYPLLMEFMNVFYFSMSEERNARVQQLYNHLKNHSDLSYDNLMRIYQKTSVYKDLSRMHQLDINRILNEVPIDIQNDFITSFGRNLLNTGININYPKENKAFFEHWKRYFSEKADKMNYKMLKLVGSLKNIKEDTSDPWFKKHMQIETFGMLLGSFLGETKP